jgi:hypothetical protein
MGAGGVFPWIKQPEHGANSNFHIVPKVKKEWSYTFVHPYIFLTWRLID